MIPMGHKIVCVFEFPDSEMKAAAEETFNKTVTAGDLKQLKEYCTYSRVKPLPEDDSSLVKSAKEQIKTLFVGNGKR